MKEQLRIYQEDQVQTFFLDRSKPFCVGEGANCDYMLPPGSCKSAKLEFVFENGCWQVRCKGDVWLSGCLVKEKAVHSEDIFVINSKQRTAVQFFKQIDSSVVPFELSSDEDILVGRSKLCRIQLCNPCVSGKHARFYKQGNQWYIQDLKSTNGTYINGSKCEDSVLKNGDKILIAPFEIYFNEKALQILGEKDEVILSVSKKVKETAQADASYLDIFWQQQCGKSIEQEEMMILNQTCRNRELIQR